MSIFQGKLQEYPFIAIDNFTAETLDSDAFFLSHCHSDHMVGLSSGEFFERLKGSKMVHLYCSETTKNLMKFDANLRHLCQYARDIPVNQPTVIHIKQDSGEMKSLVITLIPAGHCVGSIMFLFEGDQGAVLYTGDFRLHKGDIRRVQCLKSGESVKRIQGLYIDTTFCIPQMNRIPRREDTKDAMIKLMGSWLRKGSNYAVYIQCKAKYGFEYLLKEIAKAFQMKIHLDDHKYDLYSAAVTDMAEYFTKDKFTTQIHSCRWRASGSFTSYVPCGISSLNGKPVKVMTIKPSTLWFAKKKVLPDDHISYDKRQNMYRVVHSMHSSYEEIRDVVEYIRPKYVYPTVNPVNDDVIGAYDLLKDLLRSKDDDSQDAKEKQENQTSKEEGISEERVTCDQWQLGLRNETVMSPNRAKTCFSDLGIKNEAGSPPMPSFRRKLKRKKQIDNELDVGLKNNKDCSVEEKAKEKDIIASNEVSLCCSAFFSNDETSTPCSTNSSDSNEVKSFGKHVDSLRLHEKNFKRHIFAGESFEGRICQEQNFELEDLEKSREKDASEKTSARPLVHGQNSESRTFARKKNNEQNEEVENLKQQNICVGNSPERQSFGRKTDELLNFSRKNFSTESFQSEKPSRQNLGEQEQEDLKRNLAWQNSDKKTTELPNIRKENEGKRNSAQQNVVQSHEGLSFEEHCVKIKYTNGHHLLEDQDSVTTISTASKSSNKLSNVRCSIKDQCMPEKSDNGLEKPNDFSPIDQFDIPVSPGCEGPSEDKLHSLYIKISKEESVFKK